MAEPIKMLFKGLTHVGPRNSVLDGGSGLMNPFASVRGGKSVMSSFAKLLWTRVINIAKIY